MRVSVLKYVLFSIVICSFEYAKNELYFVNDKGIYLEGNVINFRNNRILADVDKEFDLNEFCQSTLSLATQLGDCIEDNEEIAHLRNIIDSHIKKHEESNTSIDLKNVDSKTKQLINEFRKELEELKKHITDKMNGELAIQPIDDKIIIKKDENSSVSEHEDFKQLENERNIVANEHYETDSSIEELKNKRKLKKRIKGLMVRSVLLVGFIFALLIPGWISSVFIIMNAALSIETIIRSYQYVKLSFKVRKMPKKKKKSR
ncbi:fam-b protein [Plasmodium berghei]|uniref:Fam-b protein n=2 Tax=Plasmodium berghei TaxID=5821 RepID=A0A509AF47_PLABA|nr:fam-b protein [Plasmodium berghei ANKA]SBW38099.1 fam-b protein [Plasmodium berghei]SCL82261.1 fam-b protein [Plasmodium berghei]SCL82376.1 fam-b protein [Plasmodium berghei]VUC54209.1 fam-b protein [Plasmodium berghei ANKA]|eukprot:XP_034420049.1 fam-b protein [Plasmodium berghei ANKA]